MTKKQDRLEIVDKIEAAAVLYKQKLVGKRFMYVFDKRYIEVIFKAENFRHLTGVDTKVPAKRFYSYAVSGNLEASQIGFSSSHPYALCTRKIKHIGDIAEMAMTECFMLEDIKTDTMSYKFGTTDLKLTLCLNKDLDTDGNEKSECFVVQSLRDEDCFSKSREVHTVTHIFSRPNNAKKYTDLLFMDKDSTMADLPPEVRALLGERLIG
ncbi:MAG: PBECR4 domain-containing protein [Oscillospiraceae bacterium]|nr:PBECR4 domain-containing protein [Oscillospiraceae bacterium]